jgi:hypothetical protein
MSCRRTTVNKKQKLIFKILDYVEFHGTLAAIKSKIELMPYNESKYFLEKLIPLLIRVFEYLISSIETDNTIYAIKALSLDVFTKVIWDNDLVKVYQMVLNL